MSTKTINANNVQKGSTIVLEGAVCRTIDVEISKPGKHGHSKVRISAIGLLDGKKRIVVMPGHDSIEVPIIEKRSAQVLSVQNKIANVMDTEAFETFNLEVPEELHGQVVDGCTVLYWVILDKKIMKQIKTG